MDTKDLFSSCFEHSTHEGTRYKMNTHKPFICYELRGEDWVLLSNSKNLMSKRMARKWLVKYARLRSRSNAYMGRHDTNKIGEKLGLAEQRARLHQSFALALKQGRKLKQRFRHDIHVMRDRTLNPILSQSYVYSVADFLVVTNINERGKITRLTGGSRRDRKRMALMIGAERTRLALANLGYVWHKKPVQLPHGTASAWIIDVSSTVTEKPTWLAQMHDAYDDRSVLINAAIRHTYSQMDSVIHSIIDY